ncbi:reverse transcriptase domain-containing protein [Tanacetum coccineum]
MEQYLTLTRGNQEPGMVKSDIDGNINFKIKSQFMRELREDAFAGNKKDDAHEHVERILDIVSLFNIPGVTLPQSCFVFSPSHLLEQLKNGWTPARIQLEEPATSKQEGDATGCTKLGERTRLDKECPLKEETKNVEEVKYEKFGRPFPNNNRINERFGGGCLDPSDLRTEELHKSLIGRGGPIAPTTVLGTDFVLKNHMVQLLRQNCQFHGFKDEDANEHLDKYLSITQFIKQKGVSQDIMNLNLFPFYLTQEAESWFYFLKTHSIHTYEEMVSKFLSNYYPYSKALQLRKDILNFQQLPMESVFEAWERYKSCLWKCPDHRILLVDQILTFYHGITMIDQDKIMVAAGGNIMLCTTTDMSAHYSKTNFASSEQVEVLSNDTGYTIQSFQHQPGPVQKSIHPLSGNPTLSSDSIIASPSPSLTPLGNSDFLLEEIDAFLALDSIPPGIDNQKYLMRREIFFCLKNY